MLEQRIELAPDEIAKAHFVSLKGLAVLSHLQEWAPMSPREPNVAVLTCLASFSNEDDAWNCSKAREQALVLAEDYINSSHLPALLTRILQTRIKPLFSKSTNPAITRQGRKAIDPIPSNATLHSDLDASTKPWKYRDVYIVTAFQWVLNHLSVRILMMQ